MFANTGFPEENLSGDQIKEIKTNPDIIYGLLEDPAAHRTVPGELQPQLSAGDWAALGGAAGLRRLPGWLRWALFQVPRKRRNGVATWPQTSISPQIASRDTCGQVS